MLQKAMVSSKSNEWTTPQWLFDKLDKEFNFTLDPCATHKNHKCNHYFTKEDDGLKQDWTNETVFCNPPYGRELPKWVKKCAEANTTVVMLIPSRTDTRYFHDYILGQTEIRFLRGRLKFSDSKNSAPFASMVVVFKVKEKRDEL